MCSILVTSPFPTDICLPDAVEAPTPNKVPAALLPASPLLVFALFLSSGSADVPRFVELKKS